MNKANSLQLINWYNANHRQLPWRKTRDPYKIWISETMLQQTTTTAVLGYYDRFLTKFTNIESLAKAPLPEVYNMWAGLGYYSRARNLHKAAKLLHENQEFPRTYRELLTYPGFGPYTARAVSSLAFSEPVGVLDGNVIRVISRKENIKSQWWASQARAELQIKVDQFVKFGSSELLNQALMELGAQICIPKNPHCKICPWIKSCKSYKANNVADRPLKKPRRESEIWIWSAEIQIERQNIYLQKNDYAPFLRGAWILPGTAKMVGIRPQRYDFRHSITHHDIYVQLRVKADKLKIRTPKSKTKKKGQEKWVKLNQLQKTSPSSLLKKAIQYASQTIY